MIPKEDEHSRYAAFRKILSSHATMTEEEIERYIELARRDADQAMAQAALLDLFLWPRLTPEQFDRLTDHPDFAAPLFQKRALRRRLQTELADASVVSATTFAACLASQDAVIQRELLSRPALTPQQLKELAEQGTTRAIRNMAHARQGMRKSTKQIP